VTVEGSEPEKSEQHQHDPEKSEQQSDPKKKPSWGTESSKDEGPRLRVLVAFLLGVVALAGPAIATDPPRAFWSWLLLLVTATLGSAGAVGTVYGDVVDALLAFLVRLGNGDVRKARDTLRDRWGRLPGALRGTVPMALVMVITVGAGLAIPRVRTAVDFWWHGCRPPPTLRVLTTSESLDAVSALATVYEQASADERDGCAAADLYVYAADPETVREALLSGWSIESLRLIGPRPDVWLPDSTVEAGRVLADAQETGAASPIASSRSIAVTPVVLGLPAATAADDPERWVRRTWSELLDEVAQERLPVVRPAPTRSLTGAIATEIVYRSVAAARPVPVTKAEAGDIDRGLERAVGRALDRGTYPLGDAQALLCRHRAETAPAGAVLVTEQQLVRYNQGLALGESCAAERAVPDAKKLVAAYPRDTLALDHPLVELDWPNDAARQVAAGREWRRWLGTRAGRRALNDVGLRPSAGKSGSLPVVEPLTERWGARPDALFVRVSPSAASVGAALENYAVASRPARTLVLLDTSGSMRTRGGAERGTRLTAARDALFAAVGQVAPADEVGLWTFPAGSAPSRQLVPIAPRPAPIGAAEFDRALTGVEPAGGTPLYRAIEAGLAGLGPPDDEKVRTLIVITDGEDTDTARPAPGALAERASRSGIRVSIVALGGASCTGLALRTLSRGTGGDCVDSGTRGLGAALIGLFDAVGGGRGGQ